MNVKSHEDKNTSFTCFQSYSRLNIMDVKSREDKNTSFTYTYYRTTQPVTLAGIC